jgi:hypothetical protein
MADIPPPPPGTPPPGPPQYSPPPIAPPYQPPAPPSYSDIPYAPAPGAPGYQPPAGYPNLQTGASVMSQFSGPAGASILIGLISIGVPLFTTIYFPILPIFGVISAIRAIMRGLLLGGVVGLVLSLLGGVMSLIASGLLFH